MLKLQRLLLILLLLLCGTKSTYAQETFSININKNLGIPNNTVYDFIQDSKGFIWMCSNAGLSRYDGFEFVTYNSIEQTSLPGSSVVEDKYGRIWYENFDGYLYYVKDEILHALPQNRPGEFVAFGIVDDYLFVSQQNGIDIYDLKLLQLMRTIEVKAKNIVGSRVFKDAYYFVGENTLFKIGRDLKLHSTSYFSNRSINVNMLSDDGNQLFLAYKNVDQHRLYFVNADLQFDRMVDLPSSSSIVTLQFVDNKYWLYTNKGFFVYDRNLNYIHSSVDLGMEFSMTKCVIDKSGNHWFSSLRQGLFLISDFNNKVYSINDLDLASIVRKKDGYLFATFQGRVFETAANFKIKDEIAGIESQNFLMNFYYDEEDDLVFNTTTKGLFIYHGKKLVYFEDIAAKRIMKLDFKYYVVTTSGFVMLIKNPTYVEDGRKSIWDYLYEKNFPSTQKKGAPLMTNLRAKSISFYGDNESQFIISSNIGLYIFDTKGYRELLIEGKSFYGTDITFYNKKLYMLDNNGNLVVVYRSGKMVSLNSEMGIPPNSIKYIKRFGNTLYLACSNRIFEFDLTVSTSVIYSFNTNMLSITDFVKTDDRLIMLSGKKIVSIGLNRKKASNPNPEFYFNNYYVHNEKVDRFKLADLKSDENSLRLTYSLLDYGSSKEPRMSYRINDGEWITLTAGSREIQLVSLSPGSYQLEVRLNNLILSDVVHFRVHYPYFLKWWFILLVILLIAAIVVLLYTMRMRAMRKKIRLLNEKIILENKLKTSMLTSIKAQMNPHFFYNALNTIQSYIFSNDKFHATTYLAKFSKLTRMILEMSGQETIKLEDELTSLKLYLELEKMRFQSDFEFTLSVPEEMEIQSIQIPSMLIQPYVENAVKHGLLHKEGEKLLEIRFIDSPDFIRVEIEDNGVGRKRSMEINQQKFDKPKSFSTESNQTRLDILNHDNDVVSVQFVDKYSSNQVPMGTIVTLNISKKWQLEQLL